MIKFNVQTKILPPQEFEFPLLARAKKSGNIYLLRSHNSGTILHVRHGAYKVGDTVNSLNTTWEVLTRDEIVELSNDN